jgi:phosphate transport system substrate-binding protein
VSCNTELSAFAIPSPALHADRHGPVSNHLPGVAERIIHPLTPVTAMFRALLLLTLGLAINAADPATTIVIDGSSTVYPITVAIGERYAAQNHTAGIEVLCSGSSAGFRRLASGEVPIAGASRPIKADELAKAAKAGIEVVELPVAYDGLSVVVNKHNTFVDHLTVAELKRIWEPSSTVTSWRQVRASFPDVPISLFGAGKDSGTFDYFTEVIVGTARASREDYTASEDDNDLVQGVVRNRGALGYFGMAYLHENEALLKAVPIDGGKGPVSPAVETVADGTYRPLSRPLFIYVNKSALARPEVRQFVDAYVAMVPAIAPQVGYVAFDQRTYELVTARLAAGTTGSIYANARDGSRLDELLMAQAVAKAPAREPATAAEAPTTTPATDEASTRSLARSAAVPVTTAPAAIARPEAGGAAPSPAAPVAAAARRTATAPDARRLDHLRDRAIRFARLTLDEDVDLGEIQARIEELRLLADGLGGSIVHTLTVPEDQAGFTALIERLDLTSAGRALLDDAALVRLKHTLGGITDTDTRRSVALALLQPGPDQLPRFTAAISAANGGRADVDAVLCYARGGFTLR